MRGAVESQGSECASPFSADLQPLSCSSHDGGTSDKDVKGLSILKPASVFNQSIRDLGCGTSCYGDKPSENTEAFESQVEVGLSGDPAWKYLNEPQHFN